MSLLKPQPIEKQPEALSLDTCQQLGDSWLAQNEIMREWLHPEIAYRLDLNSTKPFYGLVQNERENSLKSLDLNDHRIQAILEELARAMVVNYKKRYYLFQKKG